MRTEHTDRRLSRDELLAQLTAHLDALHSRDEANRQLADVVDALRRAVDEAADATAELDQMFARTPLVDPVPRAVVEQAVRRTERRRRLLATGAYDIDSLATLRAADTSATHTWLGRQRSAHRLISVTGPDQRVWVPALLIDTTDLPAQPVNGGAGTLEPLAIAGLDGWAVWVWLTTPSGWLDGEVPGDLLRTDPDRVADAARRFAGQRTSEPTSSAA